MALDTTQDLRAYLLTSTALTAFVADRICENDIPTFVDARVDYLWLRQSSRVFAHTFDSAAGEAPQALLFDVECCSRSLRNSAAMADAVRALFPYAGTMGDSTIKAAFVNDQGEDYEPLNESASKGIHVQSLQIEICP